MKAPELLNHQLAVVMADGATGHVLTTNGDICIDGKGEVFIIFNDLEAAQLFITHKQSENDMLEFVIYNSNNECIEHYLARKWKC